MKLTKCPECGSSDIFNADGDWHCGECGRIDIKIYFSHSKPDYDTEYELDCLEYIRSKYPDATIINPKDIKIPEDDKSQLSGTYNYFMKMMSKYYFTEIDKCQLLITTKSKSGKYSSGVKKEIEYAESKNILIEHLQIPYPDPNRPTLTCYVCKKQFIPEEDTEYEVDGIVNCWRCMTGE